ncbi:uncharacterized protein PV07_10419 [Cladophialophora immunda]|uniref:Maintenance of telomere capping protein 6 n=1 Tax=Cladophialophora immunda TaxID=569365 RepID=A0A0D2CME1_9EURO|nr:uncharacterized protein PV07_10419 [Cladophialophora immunda]KIW24724.1 hypothetical protein PV07_10419 [Cladophialophora immunda]
MTSLEYQPDQLAEPDDHWGTVFLSMRDASGQIPINYITHPGVYVTKACFSNGVYDDLPTQTCISDLFASQYRRLIIDLYWDNINRQFSLCPVELPPLVGNSTAGYSVDSSALSSITASTSFATPLPTTTVASNSTASLAPSVGKRQGSASSLSNFTSPISSTTASISGTPTTTSDVAIPTSTGATGGTLLKLGPYMCSLDLNIGSVISLYNDYFDHTSDTISARLHFLDINLHAAAPFTDPSSPAHTPMPGRLPGSDDLIGAQFEAALGKAIYTPQNLQDDRNDLNRSWFRDDYRVPTDANYFRTEETGENGIRSTPDGWPGETWILLTDSRRLLLSWDQIDPQMAQYDFLSESSTIFNATELFPTPHVALSESGEATAGCYYHSGDTTIAQVNASWAISTIGDINSNALSTLSQNLTACGFSPVMNVTLDGLSVQNNLLSYQDFAQSTVFGWAPGQPLNTTSANGKTDDDLRCAVLDATSQFQGRWRLETCQKSRRAACRIAGEPYAWRLSTFNVPYGAAPDACPDATSFDLPRTGLENTYLYRQILNDTTPRNDDSDGILSGVWINFNSLDQADCWVLGGPNATCPYSDFKEEEQQRQILIPTIAALIILILTVLTILVKCNQNRRNSRTRRRGDNGWEYEGIPS